MKNKNTNSACHLNKVETKAIQQTCKLEVTRDWPLTFMITSSCTWWSQPSLLLSNTISNITNNKYKYYICMCKVMWCVYIVFDKCKLPWRKAKMCFVFSLREIQAHLDPSNTCFYPKSDADLLTTRHWHLTFLLFFLLMC